MVRLVHYAARLCRLVLIRARYLVPFIVLFTIPIIYIQVTFPVRYLFKHSNVSQTCIIPKPNPFDPSILKFVWDLNPLVCDSSPSVIVLDNNGILQFNKSALDTLNLEQSTVTCTYKVLQRQVYDAQTVFTSAVPFSPPFRIDSDFFYVECKNSQNTRVFNELFATISKPKRMPTNEIKLETKDQLSVLLFAIDSVSRSQSIRKLPKTVSYLKDTLKAFDFQGHMKVGENTLPNILPLLTGRRSWSTELPTQDYAANPYDNFPFVWKNYSQRGYATLYAEDVPEFGTFNYLTKGFYNQPTTHYMHPFWKSLMHIDVIQNANPVFQYLENNNVHLQAKSSLCYGRKAKHQIQIDYVKQFFSAYKGERKFAFSFLNEICHDYPNFLGYGDESFRDFLQWLKENGHLENAALVFFSDHGSRIDKIRNTLVGRIEDRMPMLYVYLPEHVKTAFPELAENMAMNTKRLSTPFDMHQTLVDIVTQRFSAPTKLYVGDSLRGVSLFNPLPPARSCAEAWIPEVYCACYTSTSVNVTIDTNVKLIADATVKHLNTALLKVSECEQLKLYKIQDAQLISQGLQHAGTENTGISVFQFFKPENKPSLRYLVVIETVPGHGEFEGTADINPQTGIINFIGDVIRVNRYGNQPHCIRDKLLRPFCYCKKQLDA